MWAPRWYDGHTLQSVIAAERIEATWPGEQGGPPARMAEFPRLFDAPTVPAARRCSYFCEAGAVTEEVGAWRWKHWGVDLLYSA